MVQKNLRKLPEFAEDTALAGDTESESEPGVTSEAQPQLPNQPMTNAALSDLLNNPNLEHWPDLSLDSNPGPLNGTENEFKYDFGDPASLAPLEDFLRKYPGPDPDAGVKTQTPSDSTAPNSFLPSQVPPLNLPSLPDAILPQPDSEVPPVGFGPALPLLPPVPHTLNQLGPALPLLPPVPHTLDQPAAPPSLLPEVNLTVPQSEQRGLGDEVPSDLAPPPLATVPPSLSEVVLPLLPPVPHSLNQPAAPPPLLPEVNPTVPQSQQQPEGPGDPVPSNLTPPSPMEGSLFPINKRKRQPSKRNELANGIGDEIGGSRKSK